MLDIRPKCVPELDPGFVPAALWNRAYGDLLRGSKRVPLRLAIRRPGPTVSVFDTEILEYSPRTEALNNRYVERLVKFLLWHKGGSRILLSDEQATGYLASVYAPGGLRAFDGDILGRRIYRDSFSVGFCPADRMPEANEISKPLGRHTQGCRIGFDLGGSDRKSAAVIDGKAVFTEEVPWDPCFQTDPQYHLEGIRDSIRRAAAHLPRVDAIGGSAAGIYVDNEVRVASLFRGLSDSDFNRHIRFLFHDLAREWRVPFEVVNDGEVTALAGSMGLNAHAVLGVAMGTSVAAGYVGADGGLTPWMNELAFVPIDYQENAPVDEWSGDRGCAAKYLSQQAVARLAPAAGLRLPAGMPQAEQLVEVQVRMKAGDDRAASLFRTLGVYFGYAIAHFAAFYDIRHLLFLGRVTSGAGGGVIFEEARRVLREEFPELPEKLTLAVPDERMKRHGQAVAAASLPAPGGGT